MNMLTLMARLLARGADTPDTPVRVVGVSTSALPQLACTPDTSDTPKNGESVRSASDSVATQPDCRATMPCLVAAAPDGIRSVRVALFLMYHVAPEEAEQLAERLGRRDLERDDRRLCLECVHLSGAADARRCANWRVTGMRGNAIPADLVGLLQRCAGFAQCAGLAPISLAVPLDEWTAGLALFEEDGDE
jgi:hypothetical protein